MTGTGIMIALLRALVGGANPSFRRRNLKLTHARPGSLLILILALSTANLRAQDRYDRDWDDHDRAPGACFFTEANFGERGSVCATVSAWRRCPTASTTGSLRFASSDISKSRSIRIAISAVTVCECTRMWPTFSPTRSAPAIAGMTASLRLRSAAHMGG